jgi:hypothetical protein
VLNIRNKKIALKYSAKYSKQKIALNGAKYSQQKIALNSAKYSQQKNCFKQCQVFAKNCFKVLKTQRFFKT